ncbi:MAG: toxin-antitoxin system HicB family antitoxin [Clostridia bacterium]|nr:toxin-antitoxin system HicB family antitoxin [Clostridia bacterium]
MSKFDPQQYADNEIERLTLRITHKQKEELAKIAQNENVSLNTLIVRCIDYALKNK